MFLDYTLTISHIVYQVLFVHTFYFCWVVCLYIYLNLESTFILIWNLKSFIPWSTFYDLEAHLFNLTRTYDNYSYVYFVLPLSPSLYFNSIRLWTLIFRCFLWPLGLNSPFELSKDLRPSLQVCLLSPRLTSLIQLDKDLWPFYLGWPLGSPLYFSLWRTYKCLLRP